MRFKEYIEIQSKECPNRIIRRVWQDLLYNFNVKSEQEKAKKVFNKVVAQKKSDDIDGKRLFILNFYSAEDLKKLGLTDSDNISQGYKSVISDDIIGDNGDEYIYLGKTDRHKFYEKNDVYYVRSIGDTILNRVTEYNYCLYQDYIDLLNEE